MALSVEELAQRITAYPESALRYFRGGIAVSSRIAEKERHAILNELLRNLRNGRRRVRGPAFETVSTLGSRDAEQLASVYTFISGLLSEGEFSPDDFVAAARGHLFDGSTEQAARAIATDLYAIREELAVAVEAAQLSALVLPALDEFQLTVDLRLKIVDGQVKAGAPVAIAFVDSDTGDPTWFQMSRGDVEDLIEKFKNVLDQMRAAESLLPRPPK